VRCYLDLPQAATKFVDQISWTPPTAVWQGGSGLRRCSSPIKPGQSGEIVSQIGSERTARVTLPRVMCTGIFVPSPAQSAVARSDCPDASGAVDQL
jgi:hypothetical protein